MESTEKRPDVSVIVIGYNDAVHLEGAVRSVLDQTLQHLEVIISDDHSSDGTPELARRLCAEDIRVRYLRRDTNSGGCGAPRNDGLAAARGRFIMFLDSDDVLERHACKNLLLAAELDSSEIVAGLMERVFVDGSHPNHKWYPQLYTARAYAADLDGLPNQLHDTVVTNKLYSKHFLDRLNIRFLEDLHYEDLIFSAQTLSAANGISIIPETVYFWNVYPDEVRKSITNQRDSLKNLADRLRAAEIAREMFATRSEIVQREHDHKLLDHHLRIYLGDVATADDTRAAEVIDMIRPWIAEFELHAFDRLSAIEHALYSAAYVGDIPAVRAAARGMLVDALAGRVHTRGGTPFWAFGEAEARPATDARAIYISDLTPTGFADNGPQQVRRAHFTNTAEVRGLELLLSGASTDPLDYCSDGARYEIAVRSGSGSIDAATPITADRTATGVAWSARLPLPQRAGLRDHEGRFLFLDTVFKDGLRVSEPLRLDQGVTVHAPDPSSLGRALGDSWVLASRPGAQGVFEISSSWRGRQLRRGAQLLRAGLRRPYRLLSRLKSGGIS